MASYSYQLTGGMTVILAVVFVVLLAIALAAGVKSVSVLSCCGRRFYKWICGDKLRDDKDCGDQRRTRQHDMKEE